MKSMSPLAKLLIGAYILIVLGFSASAKADFKFYPISENNGDYRTEKFSGEVATTLEGNTYLILDNGSYYLLASEFDLSDFNGMMVDIIGFELKHTVGPVVELMSMDPLLDGEPQKRVDPVLVVLNISENS
jgi:hypothetical protein